jgi:O-antigen ligase
MERTLSPAKMSGYLFFVFYFLYYNPLFAKRSFPHPPHAMWWFVGYVVVYALNGFFLPEELVGDFIRFLFTILQLLLFFWIAADLLKDQKMAKTVLFTFSIGSAVLALGIVLGLPGFSATVDAGRLEALGDNANALGMLMALSAVMLIGLIVNINFSPFIRKLALPTLMLPVFVVMVQTGSRGAIAVFLIGCLVYLLPYWRSKRGLISIFLAILGIGAVTYLAATNPDVSERWQQTYYEGRLANREIIFPTAIEMILERPIFGWQPIEFSIELGFRSGFRKGSDAHNLYLHLLLEVGLVGAISFLIGLGLCGWAAWKARGGNLGLLPLALFLTLLAANMSGTGLKQKSLWLVLALALAAASTAAGVGRQQSYVFLVGRPLKNKS